MNKERVLILEKMLENSPYIQEMDYSFYKDNGVKALETKEDAPLYRSRVDIPILVAIEECRKALNLSKQEMDDLLFGKRALVVRKSGLKSNLLRNATSKEKKGEVVFYCSKALLVLMEERGVDTNGCFINEIPVPKGVILDKNKENFFESPLNERCYKAILRNARRNAILKSDAPKLINLVETTLLEKAVREYFNYLEEREMI